MDLWQYRTGKSYFPGSKFPVIHVCIQAREIKGSVWFTGSNASLIDVRGHNDLFDGKTSPEISVLRVITIRKKLLCRRNKLQVVPHVTNRSSATKNIGGFLILLNSFNFLRTTGEGNKVVWTHRPYFRDPKCWSKTIASYLCTPVTKHPGYS